MPLISTASVKMSNLHELHRTSENVDTLLAVEADVSVNDNDGQTYFDLNHGNDELKVGGSWGKMRGCHTADDKN